MKKLIIGIIIGGIIFGGIVYGANIYESNTIEYSPTDSSWEVNNVGAAINSLYDMKTELENIKSVGDATASDILAGKTALVKGVEVTGTASLSTNAVTRHYSAKTGVWGEGGGSKQTGTHTVSKNGKVLINYLCVYYKITGDGNPTVSQKLYLNGSVISTSNYSAILDLKAGDTIKGEVSVTFAHDGTKSIYATYSAALVVTEM